jgi:hypothetical protein
MGGTMTFDYSITQHRQLEVVVMNASRIRRGKRQVVTSSALRGARESESRQETPRTF